MREKQKDINTYPHRNVRCLVQNGYIRELYALMPNKTVNELIGMLEILTAKEFTQLLDRLMNDRERILRESEINRAKLDKKLDEEIQQELKAKGIK